MFAIKHGQLAGQYAWMEYSSSPSAIAIERSFDICKKYTDRCIQPLVVEAKNLKENHTLFTLYKLCLIGKLIIIGCGFKE